MDGRIPLFVNPYARRGKNARINHWIDVHKSEIIVIEPHGENEMITGILQYAQEGHPIVAVAGGDGTQRLVAGALMDTETALGIIPSGSVNVLARNLGIFDSLFEKTWTAIKAGKTKDIDIFLANGEPFLQMAGVGIDARSVELTTWQFKKRWGPMAYILSGIKAALERQPKLTVTTEQGEFTGCTVLIGNGVQYGGPLNIFKEAVYDDGLVDVIIFEKQIPHLIKDFIKFGLTRGFSPHQKGHFTYLQVPSCHITSDLNNTSYQLDGDFGGKLDLEIKHSKTRIKVLA